MTNEFIKMLDSISDEEWKDRDKVLADLMERENKNAIEVHKKEFSRCGFSEIKRLELEDGFDFHHQIIKNQKTINVKFIDNKNLSYVFRGDIGRGKTLLAHKLAWENIKESKSVLFLSSENIATFAAEVKKGNESIFKYLNVNLLVIDDIMKPKKAYTDVALDFINDVVSGRSEMSKRTIITSNDMISDLLKVTTLDRMRRNWKTLYFEGESLRKSFDI